MHVSGQSLRRASLDHISAGAQGQHDLLELLHELSLAYAGCSNYFCSFSLCFVRIYFCLVCFIPGLPIQVRDAGLSLKDEMPKSDVNKEYYTQNMEREVRKCSYNHTSSVWMCIREE